MNRNTLMRTLFLSLIAFLPLHALEKLDEAQESYLKGEKAETLAEREAAFNKALELYTHLESENHPEFGNGKLYYNIGNTYYQLEEYPQAIYYYYKSLNLRPGDDRVNANLEAALEKLGLKHREELSIFKKLFLFRFLPLPLKLQLLFFVSVILFGCFLFYQWFSTRKIKVLLEIVFALWLLAMISLAYSRFFSPVEGVIINPSILYRDAGEQYAKAAEKPIMPGIKVRVLESVENGFWLKIITPEDQVGYIPSKTVRII